MKAKNLLLTLAVGAMAISCNNSGSMTQTSASLKTTADSASFYIGYMYGSGLQQMGFSEVNREALIAGLKRPTRNPNVPERIHAGSGYEKSNGKCRKRKEIPGRKCKEIWRRYFS